MFVIKVDGREVYSPALSDDPCQLLSISLQLEIDTAGSLSFTIPPGHTANNLIHKLKSRVTMEWDGVEIFRGRVLEEKTDNYNQKQVYCEGDLSYLLDSVYRPETFTGTTKAYVERIIAKHNSQVEPYKRFALGDTSGITDDESQEFESEGYSDSLSAIRAVLEEKEGYLFTRYEDGVRYLDFVASYNENNGQAIEFGVNLLDLENEIIADDFCTIMLPIGGTLDDGTTVTIKSVNDDKDTIENTDAIAQYGRIVKTHEFEGVTEPDELLKQAKAKLESMAFTETLTLTAVDMHLLDESKGFILPGRSVLIHTMPHGINKQRKVCTALDLDPENPEKATYTFGEPTKTQSGTAALIASKVEKHTITVQQLYKHYTETDYTVQIHTGLLDSHETYISESKIEMDGINATLDLTVRKDNLISAINMSPERIRISSDMIDLDGYVTAEDLKTWDFEAFESATFNSNVWVEGTLNAMYLQGSVSDLGETSCDSLTIGDETAATQEWVSNSYATSSALSARVGEIYSWVLERGYATQAWVTANFQAKS